MVREAHMSLEALQVRLKEVRDRLDRVSREEAHYLELATLEHKLLQVGLKSKCLSKYIWIKIYVLIDSSFIPTGRTASENSL